MNKILIVIADKQGVSFGSSCWVSHEKITGHSAEQLNAGTSGIVGAEYMKWLASGQPGMTPTENTPEGATKYDWYEDPAPLKGYHRHDCVRCGHTFVGARLRETCKVCGTKIQNELEFEMWFASQSFRPFTQDKSGMKQAWVAAREVKQ